MSYAHLGVLKQYLGLSATETTDDTLLQDLLDRATTAIDNHCGRRFSANTETRYYEDDAVDGQTLYLDEDLISITTLTNGDSDSTTISSSDYWLIPRNEGPPYYGIRLKSDTTTTWEFDIDYWVSVAGTWGWNTTPPADIVQACIRLASYYYHQKDVPVYETSVFPESGVITVATGMPVDVRELLDPYRKRLG